MNKESIFTAASEQAESMLSDMTDEQLSELTNELMVIENANMDILFDQSKRIVNTMVDYKELIMMYSCAMTEVRTKLEILHTEYSVRYQRNPINAINTRIKCLTSIMGKLERNGLAFSVINIENNIHDVAGLRVICSYVDDIYVIAQALKNQADVELVTEKDYIASPKQNGYRSLHLIIRVPVFFANQTRKMNVEVQFRTIAMDFWATLEHQLKYKQQLTDNEKIVLNLKECAEIIAGTDSRMLEIRNQIEANSGVPTEEDILFEKIRKIDIPIVVNGG